MKKKEYLLIFSLALLLVFSSIFALGIYMIFNLFCMH